MHPCPPWALRGLFRAPWKPVGPEVRHYGDPRQIAGRPGGWRYFIASRFPAGTVAVPLASGPARSALSELSKVLVNLGRRIVSAGSITNDLNIVHDP